MEQTKSRGARKNSKPSIQNRSEAAKKSPQGISSNSKTRAKRTRNFWEPIFDPSFSGPISNFDWDTRASTGVKNSLCGSEELDKIMNSTSATRWAIKNFEFQSCDFIGYFTRGLTFSGCKFNNCDFGSTTWKNVKFNNCLFEKCSLTLTTFEQCQFINCNWNEIGVSGTETKIYDSVISNPLAFIGAAYTNLDKEILRQQGNTTPEFQKMRLEETKAKLSRTILLNNEQHGDDSMYYEGIKTYLTQSLRAKKERAKYEQTSKNKPAINRIITLLCEIENIVLRASGAVNGWGGSLARPALLGLFLVIFFAIIYYFEDKNLGAKLATIKSFDITLLIGYTKHATSSSEWIDQFLYAINALVGLWWYAVFVPTVINRVCRVR